MTASLVKFESVDFTYGDADEAAELYVLHDICFDVRQGEYVALIGHNGSGKSTIAKIIAGVLEINSGKVYIGGGLLTDENYQNLQKEIGMVFQNPDNQFIGATVRDDIAFGLENNCVPQEKMEALVEEYAAKVGMSQFLDREPSNLSGGQKQRVAIAGTLVRHPKILLLDEATSMLDPKGKREIRRLIRQMKEEDEKLTIISITHDIEEAYNSDRVIVLNKGRVEMEGEPGLVFSNYEKLTSINLDIPFFLQLKNELLGYGLDIKDVSDIKGLVEFLCR